MNAKETAKTLGLASLAIGLTELLAPKKVENWLGVSNGQNTGILRVLGVREVMHGVDILSHDDPTSAVWGRVAGDMLDTVLLGAAAAKTRRPGLFAAITATVLAIGGMDLICASKLSRRHSLLS